MPSIHPPTSQSPIIPPISSFNQPGLPAQKSSPFNIRDSLFSPNSSQLNQKVASHSPFRGKPELRESSDPNVSSNKHKLNKRSIGGILGGGNPGGGNGYNIFHIPQGFHPISRPQKKPDIRINNDPVWREVFLPNQSEYFYIPAKATGPKNMKVQWYYQLPNEKTIWKKIEDGLNEDTSSQVVGLRFWGAKEDTLWVKRPLNNLENFKNGVRFRAVFTDERKKISQPTSTTTIKLYGKEKFGEGELPITPLGYRVVGGKVDMSKKIPAKEMTRRVFSYRSEPHQGTMGDKSTPIRKAREIGITGTDNRKQVKNLQEFPYRAIGCLVSGNSVGTAWLISSDTIVTAAHNIYNGKNFEENMEFIIGADVKNETALSKSVIKEVWLDEEYIKATSTTKSPQKITSDFAVLKLKEPIGEEVGWLGYEWKPCVETYDSIKISTAGYPGDKDLGTLWISQGKVREGTSNILFTDLDATKGYSGSPCLLENFVAIGLNTGTTKNLLNNGNIAVRMTRPIFNFITNVKNRSGKVLID